MAESQINQPKKGMNSDTSPLSLGENSYVWALNSRLESEDGNEWNLSNESSNTWNVTFPTGFVVIGHLNIIDIKRTIYWLFNPTTKDCEIGFVLNDQPSCIDTVNLTNPPDTGLPIYSEPSELSAGPCNTYTTITSAVCLNFHIDHPILDAVYKITNKTQEIYWTDNYNHPRWMDLNNPPMFGGFLDCNLLSIFPDYKMPEIEVIEVQDTGNLKVGSYQFLVAYSNSVGSELSQYFSVTNPTPIWTNKQSELLSFDTSKSIKIEITNLDTQFTYINIAIIKTIDFTQTFEMAVTLSIPGTVLDWTYTGNEKTNKPLTREEIYARSPYYNTAETLETQNRILMMGNLVTEQRINYQPIASAIDVMWETWRIPYNKFEAYNDGVNSANIKGYMRDEVYALDMVVIEANGRVSDRFPIPGRIARSSDRVIVSNEDANNSDVDPCATPTNKQRWQVYNTANRLGSSYSTDPCYIGPWEYGNTAYWESTELYPNNPTIWGLLANTPIRHHKLPDSTVTHIHDNNTGNDIGYEHSIYPIGFKFDMDNIQLAITKSPLTDAQKANIAGIRILRSNRRTDKSIQAKGIIYSVGTYTFQGQSFLYPNYPFNDINPDVFLSTEALDPITGLYTSSASPYSGLSTASRLHGFDPNNSSRYTFLSPDTSFISPSLSGQLKLETVEYGKANAHIIPVQDNPRYEIGTQKGVKMAVVLALSTVLSYGIALKIGDVFGIDTNLQINFSNFLPAFNQALDLINKLIPFEQYGYQYNAVGNYCQYIPVPNAGNKIRNMSTVGYIGPGIETIPGETSPINNFQREQSVYLSTSPLPYPWTLGTPSDNTRFTFGSYASSTGTQLNDGQRLQRDISAYYASIKRVVPDQYGEIHSYQSLDTGTTFRIGIPTTTVFGGDTFINRFAVKRKIPFFISNTVGELDNTDVDYSQLGNVSYPTFYLSTGPEDPRISGSTLTKFNTAYTVITGFLGVIAGLSTAGMANFILMAIAIFSLLNDIISTLGVKKVNLDRFHDEGFFLRGVMYLFAYGIPYYFVESDFNCDYRQAINGTWGNFFPNVGTDIPDYWLQEKNTPINRPEEFTYNRDLSKQNLEDFYTYLPENWKPNDNSYLHTTRVIYSDPYNIEEQQNNWLLFRVNNYHDFTYSNGNLVALKAVEQDKVMALFENNTAVYNAYITLPTSIKDAVLGSGNMFANPPVEYSRTDVGYAGTQHHAFVSTPYGHYWVDAKRGCVFSIGSGGFKDIAKLGMSNWFKQNLPFHILSYFNINIDNSYNGIGLCMVWDNRFNRVFITKRDYVLNSEWIGKVFHDDTIGFYITDGVYTCPTDYTLDGTSCILTIPGTPSGTIHYLSPYSLSLYGKFGASLFDPGYTVGGVGTHTILSSSFWKSKVNAIGVWDLSNAPINEWVGFSQCFNTSVSATYYVAIAGDNFMKVQIDGVDLVLIPDKPSAIVYTAQFGALGFYDTDAAPYQIFGIFPVTIPAGNHVLSIQVLNYAGPGTIAAEIYHNTSAEIAAATSNAGLNIIFTTQGKTTFTDVGYKCPDGYAIISGPTPCDAPQCRSVIDATLHKIPISLCDTKYFCDASWTIAYSPITESWISFYSFLPNYYVAQQGHIQSGTQPNCATTSSLWDHNLSARSYTTFYNTKYNFELECVTKPSTESSTLTDIKYRADILRYEGANMRIMKDITFDKSIISSTTQTSGVLDLAVHKKGDLSNGIFAIPGVSSITIPVSQLDNINRYNLFSDVIKDHNSIKPMYTYNCANSYKTLDPGTLDYSKPGNMLRRERLKSDYFFVRLINSVAHRFKFVLKWISSGTIPMNR